MGIALTTFWQNHTKKEEIRILTRFNESVIRTIFIIACLISVNRILFRFHKLCHSDVPLSGLNTSVVTHT